MGGDGYFVWICFTLSREGSLDDRRLSDDFGTNRRRGHKALNLAGRSIQIRMVNER